MHGDLYIYLFLFPVTIHRNLIAFHLHMHTDTVFF